MRELEESLARQTEELLQRRQEIILGNAEPTDEEVERSSYHQEMSNNLPEAADPDEPRGVPLFWPTAFRTWLKYLPDAEFHVSAADEQVLEHLSCIRYSQWEPPPMKIIDEEAMSAELGIDLSQISMEGAVPEIGGPGFSLHFDFEPNPFLQSEEIVLYCYGSGEVVEVTPPVWHPNKNPTVKLVTKKKRVKGKTERVMVEKPTPSFFSVFTIITDEGMEADGADLDEEDDGDSAREKQANIVLQIREDLMTRAGLYYIHGLQPGGVEDLEEFQ